MARGKKAAKELSPEEKLQQALVPAEEQPYPIPGNWCWIHLLTSFENHTDSKKKVQSKKYLKNGKLAIVDQGQELVGGYTDDESMSYSGELPVIIFGDHTRCIKYIDFPFSQGADSVKVLSPKTFYDTRAFFFALQSVEIPNMGYRRHYPLFPQFSIPVPPLSEQHRIVSRIESLFAKLDEAKEKAQAVVDSFELRKSAILHKAFTGELTERWRKEYGVGMESWKRCTVGSVCNDVKVGIVIKPSQYYTDKNEGTPAFRSANVREYRIDDFDWVYLNEEGMVNNKRSIVHTGDVLVVRSGNPGTACVVSEKFDGYNAIDILIAVPNQELILPNYLCLFTNSPLGKQSVTEGKRGMALAHFNVKGYSKVQLNVPPISEQEKIVHTLNESLGKEQQAKEAAEAALAQIELIKKSILARAFRGELGTNDPAEEWAGELVKKAL
ncbi:hypothetical protein D1641_07545 [Colidextribacter sp. OB.20]|uniref:restriction endonuclease subunit S n=1 Tax=Colidextribacter sp. OB.20 TaxID=2304568 RepID=UPI00136C1520|nr:restriction endonuclease subunit S [Colidextribacter sp. OB.20]NBI09869.1 hypothetical protein [Colidextribacter sp. OB.20]